MHEGFEICQISENSDIGYYACMYLFIMPTPIYHVNDRILEFSLNVWCFSLFSYILLHELMFRQAVLSVLLTMQSHKKLCICAKGTSENWGLQAAALQVQWKIRPYGNAFILHCYGGCWFGEWVHRLICSNERWCMLRTCSENSETTEETRLCDAACVAWLRQRVDDLQPFCQPHGTFWWYQKVSTVTKMVKI